MTPLASAVPITRVEPVAWWIYAVFVFFVLAMLFVDLKVFHSTAKRPSNRESGAWVAIWVALAVVFGLLVLAWKGKTAAALFFGGYLIEYSLSVDNMFVFLVIFTYFAVPMEYQHRVLFFGILGALIFRGIFIALGTALINNFQWTIYIFGGLLLVTAVRIAKGTENVNPEQNPVLRLFNRRFRTSSRFHGQKLFTVEGGKRLATPLFVVLLIVETTDIVFAVDSIPAIFGLTSDPFIVLTSNVFAILGLRALYFLLAGSMDRFHLLKYGLSMILGFVGLKMLLTDFLHDYVSENQLTWISLAFIALVLSTTAVASIVFPPQLTAERLPKSPRRRRARVPKPKEKTPN